jgi:ketosteroid isomerase-like protein
MSQENVEIVRRVYRGLEQGDFWSHADSFAPDVRSARIMGPDSEGAGLSGEWHGRDGLVENLRQWLDAWDDLRVHPEEFIEAGDKVIAFTRQTGTAKASGIPLDREFADVWELQGGTVVELRFYWRREDALEAAGLKE